MGAFQLSHLSDQQLVIAFRQGKKEKAFRALYLRYATAVYKFCFRITGKREEAMDVCSEVFIKVFEKLDTLHEISTFKPWLFRIAHNQSINNCLKMQQQHWQSLDTVWDAQLAACSDQEYEEKEAEMLRMLDALLALPPETQDLLTAKYLNGDSIDTLMRRYKLSKSAVKMRLARARFKANEFFLENQI